MWIIRFLNGPLAGQIVPITKHSLLLGRAPNCDIKIASGNVSKEHTRIEVFDDKLIITDAGSRNGTFVNGVQVRSSKAKSGDKVAIHDIYFEVQKVPDNWAQRFQQPYQIYGAPPAYHGNVAYQPHPHHGHHAHAHAPEAVDEASPMNDLMNGRFPKFAGLAQAYVDRVVLPGVYQIAEMFEFKWVLAGFMAAFIMLVTALSVIPLQQILKASIEEESQQHALSIATALAKVNKDFLAAGTESAVSVDIAVNRPGVKKAYIINNLDGAILAPASQAGSYPDLSYVHEGRKTSRESVAQVDDSTVVAMYPIEFYNSDKGSHAVTHWAVVLYDMQSLAMGEGRILSLFITTLFIALLLGTILFFFLYKIIEYPIRSINTQLDTALKDGLDQIQVTYQFPALQLLASNISSALNRALSGSDGGGANKAIEHDRNREIANLVELMGFAALGIRAADLSIAAANQAFESRIGIPASQLAAMTLNELNDQALKLSIKDLLERVDQNPDELASNELEFSGLNFQVVAQGVFGLSKVAYYLIVLLPMDGEG